MAYRVRVAAPGDIARIDSLLARSYPQLLKADYSPSTLVTAIPLISRAQPRLISSGTYYVAEEDGEILGAGGWTRDGPMGGHTAGLGHIRHFATEPSALRRGVARAIMERSLSDATASGLSDLECLSTRTAVPFYQSLGFTTIGNVEIDLRPGIKFPAIAMVRSLEGRRGH